MDALKERLLSCAEASTSCVGSGPCRFPSRKASAARHRHQHTQALPFSGRDRPAALLQAPAPAISISSAQQPSPGNPVGFLRPVARDRVVEPLPLLPLQQHATDTSKGPSDSPQRSTSYKPLRASAPLITKRIKQTRTWQQLEALVAEESRNFNYVHASAALLHLTKLLQGTAAGAPGHSPTSSSKGDSPSDSPPYSEATNCSSSTKTDSRTADSHARSSHASMDPVSIQQQQQPMLQVPPILASRSSRPAASVNLAQQPPRVQALLHTLLRIVRREMPAMDVQGVSNTLYSLAVLHFPDMSLVGELMAAVQYRLDIGKPQNLANIIWSCVVLGYMPERDWMVMYYRALDIRLHAFGPVDVSNTVWAFGRLQFNGKQYRVAPDIVRKLLQQAYSVLPQLEPQHLANTLWGLARLGFVPGPMWSQAFLNATGPKLLAMHAHELCSLAWAVGKLRMAPGPVWVSQLLLATQPMLPRMQPHQLSQLLLGLSSLNARPPAQWMAAALRVSQQHASYYTPQALLQVLRGVGQLGGLSAAGFPPETAEQWLAQHLQASSAFIGGGVQDLGATGSHSSSNAEGSSPAAAAAGERNGYVDGGNHRESERSLADEESENNFLSSSSSSSSSTSTSDVDTWAADLSSSAAAFSSTAALSEHEDEHEGGHAATTSCGYQAEELAQLLYALVRMHVRPPGWWLGQVLQAFQHTPGMMHALSRDGPATAMTVWSLRQLLPGSLGPASTAAAASTTSATANNSSSGTLPMDLQRLAPELGASQAWQEQEPHPPSSSRQQQQQQPGWDQMLQSPGADGGNAAALRHHLLPFLTSLLEATGPRLQKPTYTALELATLLHALAGWGVTPPSGWMVRFWWRSLVLLSNTRRASSISGSSSSSTSSKGNQPARASAAATAAFSKGTTTIAGHSGSPPATSSTAPMRTSNGSGMAFPGAVPGSPGSSTGNSSSDIRDPHASLAPTRTTSASSSNSTRSSTGASVSIDSSIRPLGSSSSSSSSRLSPGESASPGMGSNNAGSLSNGSGMGESLVAGGSSSSSSSSSSQKKVMNPWALDMMLKALVQLRARPQEQWSRALLQASHRLLPHFAPHQFGSVLSSLAALGIKPGQGWQRSCLLESYRVWSGFTPSDWVSMLYGLARLKAKVPSDWLSCFFASTTHRLASCSIRELALLGTALCRLRAHFPPAWSSAFLAAALPKLPHANPADLLRLVTSAIHLLPELTPLSTAPHPPPDSPTSRTPAASLIPQPISTLLVDSAATLPPNELRRQWLECVVAAARSHVTAKCLRGEQQRLLARALRQMARVSQRAACREGKGMPGKGTVGRQESQARRRIASSAKGEVHSVGQDNSGDVKADQEGAVGSGGSGSVGGSSQNDSGDVKAGGQAV